MTTPHPPGGQPRPSGRPSGASPPPQHPAERDVLAARRAAQRAQLLAAAALVVALLAIIVSSVTALSGGDEGSALPTSDTRPAPTSAVEQPDPSDEPASNVEPTAIDTRRITPDDDFELVNDKQEFRLYPAEQCELRYFDVDEPRAGADREVAEFGYGSDCATIKPHIDITSDSAISLVDSPSVSAKECAQAVQRGPVNEPFVPTGETNLCLITSAEAAHREGTTRKVALIAVASIGQDGLMTIEVTTWTVPR